MDMELYNIEMYNRNEVCNDNIQIPAKKLNEKEIKEMKSNERAINTIKTNEKTAPGSQMESTLIHTQVLQGYLTQRRMKSKERNEYNENDNNTGIGPSCVRRGKGSSVVQDQLPHRADMNKQPNINFGAGVG